MTADRADHYALVIEAIAAASREDRRGVEEGIAKTCSTRTKAFAAILSYARVLSAHLDGRISAKVERISGTPDPWADEIAQIAGAFIGASGNGDYRGALEVFDTLDDRQILAVAAFLLIRAGRLLRERRSQ